eukprot:GEMP01010535.1.p1 GENE.GEMP01010535.1~~GEMP01010535.1.p1  ORF type:complete len:592 (+),score=144.00 GEMP01010535.1:82-1857(+)
MRTPRQRNGITAQPKKRASLRHKVLAGTLVTSPHSMLSESAGLVADESCFDAVEDAVSITSAILTEVRTGSQCEPALGAQGSEDRVIGSKLRADVSHDDAVLVAEDGGENHNVERVNAGFCSCGEENMQASDGDHNAERINAESCSTNEEDVQASGGDRNVEHIDAGFCSCGEEDVQASDGDHYAERINEESCSTNEEDVQASDGDRNVEHINAEFCSSSGEEGMQASGTRIAPLNLQQLKNRPKGSKPIRRMQRSLPDDAWLNYDETFEYVNEKFRRNTDIPDSRHALREHVDTLNDRMMCLIGSISSTAGIEPLAGPVFFDLTPQGGSPRAKDDPALVENPIALVEMAPSADSLPSKYVLQTSIQIAALQKEVQYLRKELAKYEQAPIEYRGWGRSMPNDRHLSTNSRGVTPRCMNSQGVTPRPRDGPSQEESAMTPSDTPRPLVNEETIITNFTAKILSFIGDGEDKPLTSTRSFGSGRIIDGELERLEEELMDSERLRIAMEQRYIKELEAAQEENIKLRHQLRIFKLQRGQLGLNASKTMTERRGESPSKRNADGDDDVAPGKLWQVVQSMTSLFSTNEISSSQCI